MPWKLRSRRGAGYSFVFAALPFALAGCVTLASSSGPAATFPPLPSTEPTASAAAIAIPTLQLVAGPTATPSAPRTPEPTPQPTPEPTPQPTPEPTPQPTPEPTPQPTPEPTPQPTPEPTATAVEAAGATSDTSAKLDRSTRRKLQAVLDNQVKNKGIAGLQAAVRMPGGETWIGTAGNAEFSPDRPVVNDTQFAIASVTKTFIAALILQLVDEGRIDLDAPFGTYFDGAPRSKNVTVRQLLSHTSGIYNYFANPRYGKAAGAWLRSAPTGLNSREHRWTYEEIMDLVKSGYCKPGACYSYSNTNYVILGQIAKAVGDAPVADQLRKRFFKPLGLKDTVYQPAQKPAIDAAHGHWGGLGGHVDHTRGARVLPFMAAVSVADAAGAIASTAPDLATWAEALYGGDVLSPESRREMTTILPAGTYGLGTDVASFHGNRGYGHRGGLRGFESSMWHFPTSGVSVALVSNHGNWITDEPMLKLVRHALGKN